ncbi:DNA/RNA nuclease SfsA [Pelovirga terrestris]|uniref:Sugar fermentation stimulation protein homolog n=1 Tax=Pelovirga terrestris TaxID=2771352 RepID=A0A8J6QKA5_9BACT|nr:DNA/RNA nuclease SfsA [Pelovirga terrestris]MBD1399739.1 DNA/RNA nuclease SfsA [Pelovirga terrestris]
MKLPAPLFAGTLLRRYKRFLTDIERPDGTIITAHTPNTGSMQQCAVPGYPVLFSAANNPKRNIPWTLELIQVGHDWVDTHTLRSNQLVAEALEQGWIPEFRDYQVRAEFPYGGSRIDFLLTKGDEKVLLEVKNVTLCCEAETACFPDAVTVRGQKHLLELEGALRQGYRSVIFFLVQRSEARYFSPADKVDPEYGRLLRQAAAAGVEILAYKTLTTLEENRVAEKIMVKL